MALVANLIVDALLELGVLAPGETPTAADQQLALRYLQRQIDAWGADRLTLSLQLRTPFTLVSGSSSVQVGPGQTVNIVRPVWINSINFIVPGTNPGVESPLGQMDEDAYAAISIKQLSSQLPLQFFYQTNLSDAFGTLFFWPRVSQNVDIAIYSPQAVEVPTSIATDLIGPPGYAEAFLYQLATRLVTPFGVAPPPMLASNTQNATMVMKRQNVNPGILSVDPALMPFTGCGFNVLSGVVQTTK